MEEHLVLRYITTVQLLEALALNIMVTTYQLLVVVLLLSIPEVVWEKVQPTNLVVEQ